MGIETAQQRSNGDQVIDRLNQISDANLTMSVRDRMVDVTLTAANNSTVTLPSVAEAAGMLFVIRLVAVGTGTLTIQDKSDDAGFTNRTLSVAGDYVVLLATEQGIWAEIAAAGQAAASIDLANGKILIGNASGNAAEQTVSGDGTLSNAGVLAISALAGDVLAATNKKLQFRDTGIYINSGADGKITIFADGTGIDDITLDGSVQVADFLEPQKGITRSHYYEIFDDFNYQTITEADTPWILNSGADAQAIDPAINAQERGVIRLTTGDADGTFANDGSQFACHIPVQADSGGLVFETRLHINTAITDVSVFAGLTDSTSLEEAFSNSADVITSTASDGCGFLYDTDATTDDWWTVAVDTDVDDTGNASSGTAPVADTYQILRLEVSADGNTVTFYINGVLEATLTGGGISPDVNLYATVSACATTTTSKTVDVDYVYVGHTR